MSTALLSGFSRNVRPEVYRSGRHDCPKPLTLNGFCHLVMPPGMYHSPKTRKFVEAMGNWVSRRFRLATVVYAIFDDHLMLRRAHDGTCSARLARGSWCTSTRTTSRRCGSGLCVPVARKA